jgi:hypothetical protein
MAEIRIERLIPSSGAAPSEGYDPISSAGFTEWELNDEARFSVVTPPTYRAGNDFYLRIHESTPSTSARHKWQVETLLIRPGMHVTDEQAAKETFSAEYTSAATPDQLSKRAFAVTGQAGAGRVADVSLSPGDYLSFTLKRIAASTGEDLNPVKVFSLALDVHLDETAVSDCHGRVGKIVDTVRDLFNETGEDFLSDEFILRSINRCLQDLAQEDYWRSETWLPASSGVYRIDLSTAIDDHQSLHQLRFSGESSPMAPVGSYKVFDELRTSAAVRGTPEYYTVQANTLLIWPPPSVTQQSGFCAYHSYLPNDLTCSETNPDPPLPRAHDMVFVYFVLKQAFLRDRHAPGAEMKFQQYSMLYEREKAKLLAEAEQPGLAIRPHR